MNVNDLKQSRFLTRRDVGSGVLVTIKEIYQDTVSGDDKTEELRWCIKFVELEKPFVLNSTNGQVIAQITKSDESDNWVGHKIVLYDEPNISFGGRLVGGIRVRAPRPQAPSKPVFQPRPAPSPAPVQPALVQPEPPQDFDEHGNPVDPDIGF